MSQPVAAYLPSVARALAEGFARVEPAPLTDPDVRELLGQPPAIELRLAAAHTRGSRVRREWRTIERYRRQGMGPAEVARPIEPVALGQARVQRSVQEGSETMVTCPACAGVGASFDEEGNEVPCTQCEGEREVVRSLEREATDLVEDHEYTYIPGRLGILDAELRGYLRAVQTPFPDCLRLTLNASVATGPYRDAPTARRDTFEDFDLREAQALARGHHAGFTGEATVGRWTYDAWALPVVLVAYGREGRSHVLGLVALRGVIDVLFASTA